MKQLLLNFLFFVGAAFILVQCAKLFPTTEKISRRPSQRLSATGHTTQHNKDNQPMRALDASIYKPAFRNPFSNNPSFPNNVMIYINNHSLFYNPYINFDYYDLVNKYKAKSRHDK